MEVAGRRLPVGSEGTWVKSWSTVIGCSAGLPVRPVNSVSMKAPEGCQSAGGWTTMPARLEIGVLEVDEGQPGQELLRAQDGVARFSGETGAQAGVRGDGRNSGAVTESSVKGWANV